MKSILISFLSLINGYSSLAQGNNGSIDPLKNEAAKNIQSGYDTYKNIALNIWGYAEVGYKEIKSSLLLQNTLQENDFPVQAGIASMPTAFVATYGSGRPVIGIIAEYDALTAL